MKNRFLVFLLLVSSLAYGDRMQNDNIDMQGNAIKNADVQGGTASDTSRITVPKAATATLDGLTRKEGTVVFDSTTKKLKVDNGTTLSPVGSGEGGGGLNAVTNPTAATDLTGYSDSDADAAGNDYIRTDTAAELPLNPAVTTGIKIVPDASSEYIAYCGTMPEALQNRKLRFNQFQKVESGYDSGDMRLEIYPSTSSTCASVGTEYALNKDSSGVTAIPSATQDFWVTFDADGSDYFQVRWVRTNASAEYIVVQNVSIGTGDQASGEPSSGPAAYTLTIGAITTPPTPGTGATSTATWSRKGSKLKVNYSFNQAAAGSAGSGIYLFPIPSGLTIDTAKYQGLATSQAVVGAATGYDGSKSYTGTANIYDSTRVLLIVGNEATTPTALGSSFNALSATTIRMSFDAEVYIAEWGDSSNVVQYGQQDVEYVSNSSATNADDTTSFAYGQQGSLLLTSTPASAAIFKRVRFQSPILANDILIFEVSDDRVQWYQLPSVIPNVMENLRYDGTNYIGGGAINRINSTDANVYFGKYRMGTSSAWVDTAYWRVKKISGNALGGFQYATATSYGLVKGGNVPGQSSTTAIASGYIGEVLTTVEQTAQNAAGSGAYKTFCQRALPAGVWMVTGRLLTLKNSATITNGQASVALVDVADSVSSSVFGLDTADVVGVTWDRIQLNVPNVPFYSDGTKTAYLNASFPYSAGTPQVRTCSITAVRAG